VSAEIQVSWQVLSRDCSFVVFCVLVVGGSWLAHQGLCRGCRIGERVVKVSELVRTRDCVRVGEVTCRLA